MQQLLWVATFGGAIVAAALVLRFLPTQPGFRVRLRRSVLLYIGLLLLVAVLAVAPRIVSPTVVSGLEFAGDLLIIVISLNLLAMAIFDLAFRMLRFRYPEIVHDVVVGLAYVVAIVWLMHRSGVNIASIVATSAVATAVIGLSLQSTLGSVIGGLALQLDDSLSAGDWIELESGLQGCVKQVRWRHTLVETRDGDTLIVPNNQLLNQTIKNLGKRDESPLQRRVWVNFNVDFRYSPAEVTRVVDRALAEASIPGVAATPRPSTVCVDLAGAGRDSFAFYGTRYWLTDFANPDVASSVVRERIYVALKRARIPLAMPAAAHFVSQDEPMREERKREKAVASAMQALARVEIFRDLSHEELESLAATVDVWPVSRGEVITRQGATANWLYVLVDGEVEVRVEGAGEERRVNTLSAPNFFGEMALMAGAPREATVAALTDVRCIRVDKDHFRALLQRRPEIAGDVAAVLAERRVALMATREGLDADAKSRRVEGERTRILSTVKAFFALGD